MCDVCVRVCVSKVAGAIASNWRWGARACMCGATGGIHLAGIADHVRSVGRGRVCGGSRRAGAGWAGAASGAGDDSHSAGHSA